MTIEQEPKYCDRNICTKNQYNGIGCDECEVTKSQEPTDENLHREREQAYMQGYEDASKRFRQEPCEDAISRDAVIDSLYDWSDHSMTDAETWHLRQVIGDIKSLPSVNPQPCEDAISRQAVMNCFKKWQPYMATRLWEFEQELSALPPVSPQPCEDAISRQVLLKLMGEEPFNWTDSNQELQAVEDYRNFRNMVEQLPSVKPQEKTGHWIKYGKLYQCSECKELSCCQGKFCNDCGAKMD